MSTTRQPSRTLILFDVDGVLVHPVGYKKALHDTLDYFAAQMGLGGLGLDDHEIGVFEACGITNEWDSGALCLSTILLAALSERPDLRRATLDETLAAVRAAGLRIARPDFTTLAREIVQRNTDHQVPAALGLTLLADRTDAANLPLLSALLGDVYSLETPTTRVFQTHTLGSEHFAAAYGQPAPLERESYLKTHDIPLLDAAHRDHLLQWAAQPGHGAVILTARPSLPPADLPDESGSGYAPEAELAAELVGLHGRLPLIASGRVGWLAQRNRRVVADYVKPSPVQALAAIGAAASGVESAALEAAADLYERDILSGPLAALAGGFTRVIVFEDAVPGIRAVQLAVERLRAAGLSIAFEGIGVSSHTDKRAALAEIAVHVVDDVNTGLDLILTA